MKTTVASEASTMIALLCLSFLCGANAFIVKPSTISAGAARFVRASSQPSIADKKIMRAQLRMAVAIPSTIATRSTDSVTDSVAIDLEGVHLSGLNGLALKPKTFPTKREVIDVVPKHCFVKDTWRSMKYAAISVSMTLAIGALAAVFLPLKLAVLPAWIAYSIVCGTVATGAWVVAHECGHGAFSDNKTLQDSVGFVLHSALMVPYFSWQRSHAVHHANTNHMENGETHVPEVASVSPLAKQREISQKIFGKGLGTVVFGAMSVFNHLVVGWPAYLLFGATGGPSRGMTSHFFPHPPFSTGERATDLYPGKWKQKVWLSNAGIAATLFALAAWTAKAGVMRVAALYGGPLLVVNSWLVLITWLQHTEVDVPHFDAANWNFIKGALHTVDRPYGRVLDFLHHRIGSTHVAHHVDCTIPHYHALEATNAIKEAFPEHYLYDPTPLPQATWRLATQCVGVEKRGDMHVFVN